MNIFFDLDGTLIDARQRLYALFQALVPVSQLSFDEYWQLKRQQLDHRYILENLFNYSVQQIEQFIEIWMREIEMEEWLLLDQPFEGVTAFLKHLANFADLYLVTARQKPEMVVKQIERFNWENYFKGLLVTRQENEKDDIIRATVNVGKTDFIAGDTGKDIQAGKALGIRTIGVLSGFRNRDQLLKYQPDFITDIITSFTFDNFLKKNLN